MRFMRFVVCELFSLSLVSCGGGGSSPLPTYTIGGSVSGLSGSGLMLRNNSGNDLTVNANGSFTFSGSLQNSQSYAVSVQAQPSRPTQDCVVANGAGVVNGANVSNISIVCTTVSFQVAGTVSGLTGTGLQLQNQAGVLLPISSNGAFQFPGTALSGSMFSVLVASQPSAPRQVCKLSDNAGIIGGGDTAIMVVCNQGAAKFIYSVSNLGNFISGLNIDGTTGLMSAMGGSPFTTTSPTNPVATASGKFLYVINQTNATVSGFAVDAATGALAAVPGSPFNAVSTTIFLASPVIDPTDRFLYVVAQPTTQLTVYIYAYSINSSTGALSPLAGSPFTAIDRPTWIGVDPFGRYLFSVAMSGVLGAYLIDNATGALSANGSAQGLAGSQINMPIGAVSADGSFVFSLNPDVINSFAVDGATGKATFAGAKSTGGGPRFLKIDPLGRFVYVATLGSINGFSISRPSGLLTAVPGLPYTFTAQVEDIDIDPSGAYLYAPLSSGALQGYSINASTGSLTPVPGSPYNTLAIYASYPRIDPAGTSLYIGTYVSSTAQSVQKYSIAATTGALTLVGASSAIAPNSLTLVGTR